jgi:hypothetical protein
MFRRRQSAASGGSFAGDQVVTFGSCVCLDSGQVLASRARLPRLHFDFSKRTRTSNSFGIAKALS